MIELKECGVVLDPETHTYDLNGKELYGITGTLVNRAYPKDVLYVGVSDDVLSSAASRGTACHQAVADCFELGVITDGYEAITNEAVRLIEGKGLTPIRFEYIVTDYDRYASPIDIVCVDREGNVCIVDMKFTSRLHYESVALQTSIYARFFHMVNPDLQAKQLYALWIHTNDNLEVLESGILNLPFSAEKVLDDLMEADRKDKPFGMDAYYGNLPSKVAQVEDYMIALQRGIKEKTDELNNLKEGLCKMMLDYGIKSYSSEKIQMTTVTPKPRETFDAARFKKENPLLYARYTKLSETKPSVRITIKES